MYKNEVEQLVKEYATKEGIGSEIETWLAHSSQYDDTSAAINYSFVRHFKPKVVVEFGTRTGRCTHDILRALLKNNQPFIFKPYELEDENRKIAQDEIDRIFGEESVQIGGDIIKANDIPDNIDYLFIDNYHDEETTNWVFDYLIKKCSPNALIHIHDLSIGGNFGEGGEFKVLADSFIEQDMIIEQGKNGTLPFEKLFGLLSTMVHIVNLRGGG
jgi:predicted O-methyltransferase YrrM